jgi:hypothetical protein
MIPVEPNTAAMWYLRSVFPKTPTVGSIAWLLGYQTISKSLIGNPYRVSAFTMSFAKRRQTPFKLQMGREITTMVNQELHLARLYSVCGSSPWQPPWPNTTSSILTPPRRSNYSAMESNCNSNKWTARWVLELWVSGMNKTFQPYNHCYS